MRDPQYIQRSSEIIDRQVMHMTDLVNDLMDVSRVSRGLASIEKKRVHMAEVISSAVEQSKPLMDARQHAFTLEGVDTDAVVLGDRTRLVQVLTNLLNNAAKYTPPGGHVRLAAVSRTSRIQVSVEDDGVGIDGSLLPHVFELFTQAERTPEREQGGLGLGLALVKSIVALHDGTIRAESPGLGKGSRFTVSLPTAANGKGA
jgi:hypothetical protein